jgi:hypothetical protein
MNSAVETRGQERNYTQRKLYLGARLARKMEGFTYAGKRGGLCVGELPGVASTLQAYDELQRKAASRRRICGLRFRGGHHAMKLAPVVVRCIVASSCLEFRTASYHWSRPPRTLYTTSVIAVLPTHRPCTPLRQICSQSEGCRGRSRTLSWPRQYEG